MRSRAVLNWVAETALLAMNLCLFSAPGSAGATSPPASAEPFAARHWTSEDGLPQNNISALAQTPDG